MQYSFFFFRNYHFITLRGQVHYARRYYYVTDKRNAMSRHLLLRANYILQCKTFSDVIFVINFT